MKTFIAAALSLLTLGTASAANKCTGPDGKVTYQDAPCTGAAKSAAVELQPSQSELEKLARQQWRFSRERDPMTDEVMCFAISSEVWLGAGYRQTADVHIQFAVNPNTRGSTLTVRSRQGQTSGIFHVNIDGTGIKVDNNPFVPIAKKISPHAIGFEPGSTTQLVTQMLSAKEARLRIRLWPYDALRDTDAISMRGAQQALQSAMQCGAKP